MTDTPLSDGPASIAAELRSWPAITQGDALSVSTTALLMERASDAVEGLLARAALEAARYGELERYLNESRPYLEAFRLKEAGQVLMGEIDRMPVRQLCKRADALLSSIGASQP